MPRSAVASPQHSAIAIAGRGRPSPPPEPLRSRPEPELRARRTTVPLRRLQLLLPAPAVPLHDRLRAQRRRRNVADRGARLGVRGRREPEIRCSRSRTSTTKTPSTPSTTRCEGRAARRQARAPPGEQLARLRGHAAVREVVPGACRTTLTARRSTTTASTPTKRFRLLQGFAAHVIARRNRYTGLRYCEDPTIMAFELANEPVPHRQVRGRLLGWAAEMSAGSNNWRRINWLPSATKASSARPATPTTRTPTTRATTGCVPAPPHVDYGTSTSTPRAGARSRPQARCDPITWGEPGSPGISRTPAGSASPRYWRSTACVSTPTKDVPDEAARTRVTAVDEHGRTEGAGDQFWLLTSRWTMVPTTPTTTDIGSSGATTTPIRPTTRHSCSPPTREE